MPGLDREGPPIGDAVAARLKRLCQDLRTARQRCEDVVRLGCDWFWEIDRQLRVVAVSERVIEAVDFPAALVIGQRLDDLVEEPSALVARLCVPELFTDLMVSFVAADGATRRYRLSGAPVFCAETGAFRGFRGIATRAPRALPASSPPEPADAEATTRDARASAAPPTPSRERPPDDVPSGPTPPSLAVLSAQALEQSPVLVMITDRRGRIEYVNRQFTEVTGYRPEEVIGRTPAFLKSGVTEAETYRTMRTTIEGGREWRGELCNRRKDGEPYWTRETIAPIRNADGAITHFVAFGEDIGSRRDAEERLLHQASHDGLTGLPNRALFFDRLGQALARARIEGRMLALCFVDLDKFRLINDGFGPAVGDGILRQLARRLAEWAGPMATVARLASDEFAIVLADGGERGHVAAAAPALVAALARPYAVGDVEVVVSASVGIALFPDDGVDEHALLRHAEAANQRAKKRGGNTCQFHAAETNARASDTSAMVRDLHRAIERDQLDLCYQPVFDAHRDVIVGAEALLRWRHPQRGLIMPGEFIGLAEETGLIAPIGAWVLERACAQNRAWRDAGLPPIRVAVNVSSRQMHRGEMLELVVAAMRRHQLPPSALGIEITESVFLSEVEQTTRTLRELLEMGVAIAVDDFGTGYSSLSYLRLLPVTTLKIDRAFVKDITTNRDAAAITDAIIAMGHKLNLAVVAEGVEHAEQMRMLRDKGCHLMQGYFFGVPMAATKVATLLAEQGRRHAVLPLSGHGRAGGANSLLTAKAAPTHQAP